MIALTFIRTAKIPALHNLQPKNPVVRMVFSLRETDISSTYDWFCMLWNSSVHFCPIFDIKKPQGNIYNY